MNVRLNLAGTILYFETVARLLQGIGKAVARLSQRLYHNLVL